MLRQTLRGMAAGAVGTVALNVSTYIDMAVRGRPPSGVPAKIVGSLADQFGINLAADAQPPQDQDSWEHQSGQQQQMTRNQQDQREQQRKQAEQKAEQRKSGLGQLMGYAVGLGVGTGYGFLRTWVPRNTIVTPLVLGLAAMAASDVPAITVAGSDPRTWGVSGWLSDLLPHMAYGLFTMVAFEAMNED